ncbi:MAG: cell fate regulator YaaT (PSP1 superfamily) [Alteromonas macleodii]|jgi:cell fate regulator YaaT (PSP1 superfamily)
MGCSGCSNGKTESGLPRGCKNNGACETGSCDKLSVFNYLSNMEDTVGYTVSEFVEVRFKNTRKQFFKQDNMRLIEGDVVTVEASPGHDIGTVSLSGDLVMLQMRKRKVDSATADLKKIYRKATQPDIEKWQEAVELEKATQTRARIIARELGLNMKISDVEFQADKSKAVFYYTAEERVDFRELIRKYADEFKVRVEMKQIGARQEAARVGGIGTCGRELCCSTWLTDFRTVSTSAARYQQLSLNPQKLAGQCGKLKCCLNFELDSYLDALKGFPSQKTKLETQKGTAFTMKVDIFRGIMWFTFRDDPSNFIEVPIERVKEIQQMNKDGEKPAMLVEKEYVAVPVVKHDYENVVGQDDLTRFDRPKGQGGQKNRSSNKRRNNRNRNSNRKPGSAPNKPNTPNASK